MPRAYAVLLSEKDPYAGAMAFGVCGRCSAQDNDTLMAMATRRLGEMFGMHSSTHGGCMQFMTTPLATPANEIALVGRKLRQEVEIAATSGCLDERIRAAIDDAADEEILTALSIVLVERALNHERRDGTRGTPSEVKEFVNGLTNGMIDICTNEDFPPSS
jgi:hypothetical protein